MQDERCKALGLVHTDMQWMSTTSDARSDARYSSDDAYTITGLQVRACRATKDTKYLVRSAQA